MTITTSPTLTGVLVHATIGIDDDRLVVTLRDQAGVEHTIIGTGDLAFRLWESTFHDRQRPAGTIARYEIGVRDQDNELWLVSFSSAWVQP